MLSGVVSTAFAMIGLALLLNLWRVLHGPALPDRIVGLDAMYINAIALLVLLGIHWNNDRYFAAALLIAMLGFVATVALAKYLLRGDIIE